MTHSEPPQPSRSWPVLQPHTAESDAARNDVEWTVPQQLLTRRARRRRRARWAVAATLILLVAGVVALVALTNLATSLSGTPVPTSADRAHQQSSSDTTRHARAPDDYAARVDGTGWATQPFDQPAPVPGYSWVGWENHPQGRCAWLPADLFASLATGPPKAGGHFCHIPVAGGDDLQILWGGTYRPMLEHPAFVYPTTVAGLEARVYDLPLNQQEYPGSCHIKVNTRSLSSLSVLNWNPRKQPVDRQARCTVARQAAELIARWMVPAAGGAIWPATPQQPKPDALPRRGACAIVRTLAVRLAAIGGTPAQHRTEHGETCTYDNNGNRLVALVTDGPGQGLDQIPPPAGATVTPRNLGALPARQELVGTPARSRSRSCPVACSELSTATTSTPDRHARPPRSSPARPCTDSWKTPKPTTHQHRHRLSWGTR